MIRKITLFTVALLIQNSAYSATIAINKGVAAGFSLVDSSGQAILATTGFISIGTFASAPTNPGDGNYSSLVSSFIPFGAVQSNLIPITSATGFVNQANPLNFNNRQVYLLVGNGTTIANSTQIGLFTQTTPTFFTADITLAGSTNFALTTGNIVSAVAGAGSVVDNATGVDNLKLVSLTTVPEPSAALLGALGVLGLLRRRRI